ncbi:MAG TPA: PAS domain-containing protein, partial [Gammaproteobacteria bacterium]|nr:PAS domain-containing protein [Gammaproteobacteria bacterium]
MRKNYDDALSVEIILDNFLRNTPEHCYWKNKDLIYIGCNDKQAQSLGFKYGYEVLGKSDFDLKGTKKQVEQFRQNDLEVMQSGQSKIIEEKTIIDGKAGVALSIKSPLYDDKGNCVGILGISVDISKEKKIQQALAEQINKTEKANYATIRFISTASHEIRNPMTNVISLQQIIKGKLDVLQDIFYQKILTLLNDKNKKEISAEIAKNFHDIYEYAHTCSSEAYRTLTALQNLGDLHRMQLDGVATNFLSVEINDLVKRSVDNSTYLNTKNIEIHVNISK